MTTNDNEWYNQWQQVIMSGTTNENGTVHLKKMDDCHPYYDKTDTLLQGMDSFK